jgi:hypothetical protein
VTRNDDPLSPSASFVSGPPVAVSPRVFFAYISCVVTESPPNCQACDRSTVFPLHSHKPLLSLRVHLTAMTYLPPVAFLPYAGGAFDLPSDENKAEQDREASPPAPRPAARPRSGLTRCQATATPAPSSSSSAKASEDSSASDYEKE